ncbi:isoprenylcysteine carboxylmethyltransferase family protein [Thalassotalea euphylliae]|uniref:Isoprenylcysteine carboxylmethyltransferase family protein n=1 Tax=Thalassotalea euphylliae TaxID=1655234 RepID=A0A3E0TT44_9GAMM|nr:isoprenylcysteine carboxylmethyltransferase family protein [Thalassotalea euphylliae]REL27095.1 isoprenylcysteine carboxylmethyltransferase family protein [Thalassotalea euphylliae]
MEALKLKVPPVVLVFITMLLMTLTKSTTPQWALTFEFASALATTLIAVGAAIAIAGVWAFKRAQTTVNPMAPSEASNLVCTGIYRLTRNPMYLGFLLALLAFASYLQHPMTLIWCALFVWYMTEFQIKPEEHMLAEIFGRPYHDYCSQVRRWL